MSFKTFASPIALAAAAALTLGSAAFAQTMVGDQEISDEDLPAVTEHCLALAEGVTVDDAAAEAPAEADVEAEVNANAVPAAPGEDAAVADDAGAADADAAADNAGELPALDLEAITLEDCQAAGL